MFPGVLYLYISDMMSLISVRFEYMCSICWEVADYYRPFRDVLHHGQNTDIGQLDDVDLELPHRDIMGIHMET